MGFYQSDVTWTDGRKEENDFFFLKMDLFLSVLFVSFLLSPLLGAEMLRAEPSLCGNIGFTCLRHQLLRRECVHASVCARATRLWCEREHAYNEGMTGREGEEEEREGESKGGVVFNRG